MSQPDGPKPCHFWDADNNSWRPAVPGEPGDLVWNSTTQSWQPGSIGGNFKWNGTGWEPGPGGTHKWNGSVWVPVIEAGYGGSHYWNGSVWIPNQGNPPEAATLIARMTTAPSGDRADLIGELIADLKTAGVWTKLDVLYVLAAHDAQAARLNWKSSSFSLTAVNSPTFTTDRGYAGDGSTSYLDTGWDAATNGVNFTQNSANIFGWSRTEAAEAGTSNRWIGNGTDGITFLAARLSNNNAGYRVNSSTTTFQANTDGRGLYAASRSDASTTQFYRNGSAFGSAASLASAALTTVDVSIGRAASAFSPAQCAAMGLGANLSADEHAALYTALNTYMTAVGAA